MYSFGWYLVCCVLFMICFIVRLLAFRSGFGAGHRSSAALESSLWEVGPKASSDSWTFVSKVLGSLKFLFNSETTLP